MKILRVNMSDLQTTLEDLPEEWKILGGRGLSAEILNREVPPATDPLAPESKLIVAGGPLAGTLAPSCGRVSIGAKSPLTFGIKEANTGGPAAQKLDRLGIRAIVVEGEPDDENLYVLNITKEAVTLDSADQFRGMTNYALMDAMQKRYNGKATMISIGPGGENRWKSATVASTDMDGRPARHAARGGLGAVMGAKGLKAIRIDDSGAPALDLADRETFRETLKNFAEAIKADPRLQNTSKYGTPAGIIGYRSMGSMPSRNYSSEQTEGYEALGGEAIEKLNRERGGRMSGCMPGCVVRCSIVFNDADGKYLTSALEYESIALLGTNLGLIDPDAVAGLDRKCDELGVDTIEIGSAMGVAASAGKMEFGNADSAFALFDEIEKGTEFGTTLANGVVSTCKALGIDRIPAFKGQAIPAHDPRATKATGVTYHTSPMGADHTAGVSYDDALSKDGQVQRSMRSQPFLGMMDSLGYCILAIPGDVRTLLGSLKDLINARYGLNIEQGDMFAIGAKTIKTELAFNEGTEFHHIHPYPEFLRSEPLAPSGSVFDVDPDEIATIWNELG